MYLKLALFLQICMGVRLQTISEGASKFRILAPQFICPKDGEAVVEKPDNTVITLQTAAGVELDIVWTVRWIPLKQPTQRFTLMLWKTVRNLEKQLNKPQPEPYVYVIDNSELLRGVNYIFNVTAVEDDSTQPPKSFNIDNTQGDQKLMIEGRNDMLSIILVGSQITYTDASFAIEAQVTTCFPTQDYYFTWTIINVETGDVVNASNTQGSQLYLESYVLKAGCVYNINCKVTKESNSNLITQTNIPFKVLYRGLKVYLNIDYIVVSADFAFSIESLVINHDYYDEYVNYEWTCTYQNENCDSADSVSNETLHFPVGLSQLGKYEITLTVRVLDQTSVTNATIEVVAASLPIIQVTPINRLLNEGSEVKLVANASNVTPHCTMSWYFSANVSLSQEMNTNGSCDECEHGEPLSEALTIYSLEEQFLSELADFTNDTEWRQVTVTMPAKAGRARFFVKCECSLTFNCYTLGSVYADIRLQLNESPNVGELKISPDTGTAMETLFRISALAASDPETPLKYTFYCKINENYNLMLASYYEHRAFEAFLPYLKDGTELWVEVCDSLGACSPGSSKVVQTSQGQGRTLDILIENIKAYARRCELDLLQSIVVSAAVTYINYPQNEFFTKLNEAVKTSIDLIDVGCSAEIVDRLPSLLLNFEKIGLDMAV